METFKNEITVSELVFGPSVETRIQMKYAALIKKTQAVDTFLNTSTNYISELEKMKNRLHESQVIGQCSKCKEMTELKNSCCGDHYVQID